MICLYDCLVWYIRDKQEERQAYPLNGNLKVKLGQRLATVVRKQSHDLNRPWFAWFPSSLKIDGQERVQNAHAICRW